MNYTVLPMNDEPSDRVIAILAAVKRIPAESISAEASLEQLGIDSLDKVNILFELENEFSVDISDEEARKINTVAEIIERLRSVVGQDQGREA